MLRMPPFRFRPATSLGDAAQILAGEGGQTRIVAGGTDLWPNLKRRHQTVDTVVSLQRIGEMRGIREASDGEIVIGAMTTLAEIARNELLGDRFPALVRAVRSISTPVLRNMGTIGGNLCLDTRCTYYNQSEEWRRSIDYCMKEAGDVCWVAPSSSRCWATSSSDSAPILCALNARVTLVSVEGKREIPVRALYRDDGIEYLAKRQDEILTELILSPPGDSKTSFWKLRRRGSIDFAVLTVAAALEIDPEGTVTGADIYLGSVTSYPSPVEETVKRLVGAKLTEEVIDEAARVARKAATPLNNTDFIPQWRGLMVERYVGAVLREIAGLDVGCFAPRHGFDAP